MSWIDEGIRDNWIEGDRRQTRARRRAVFSVAQVAEMTGVTKQTVMKWLSIDDPESAVIPPDGWFRLPNGYIRIRERVVVTLRNEFSGKNA